MAFKVIKMEEDIEKLELVIPNKKEEYIVNYDLCNKDIENYYERCLIKAEKSRKIEIGIQLLYSVCGMESCRDSLKIALKIIKRFCENSILNIYLIIPKDENIRYSGEIYAKVNDYLNSKYIKGNRIFLGVRDDPMQSNFFITACETACGGVLGAITIGKRFTHTNELKRMNSLSEKKNREIESLMNNVGETFQECLFKFINNKKIEDVDVYKGARIDKRLFSKIKCNVNYKPSKYTVFALAISMKLTLSETKELLSSAGLAISLSSKFDIIIQYVLENSIYDIDEIDYILCDYGQEKYIFNQC